MINVIKSVRNAAAAAVICGTLFTLAAPSPLASAHAIGALKSPIKPPKGSCIAKRTLSLRAAPTKRSDKIGTIARGTIVTVSAKRKSWYRVSGGGAAGWTRRDHVRCSR